MSQRSVWRLIVVLISICGVTGALLPTMAQVTLADVAAQAAEAYNNGDYLQAIESYELLIVNDVRTAAVYYNLGSSYFMTDDLGRALLNFRRAQRLEPRDGEVNRALAIVRALRVDIQGDEAALPDLIASVTATVLTVDELAWIALGVWVVCCILGVAVVLLPAWSIRLRPALMIACAGAILLGGLYFGRTYADSMRPPAVVIGFTTEVMSGPGENYLMIFDLYPAAELRILEAQNGWLRIHLLDGRQGWVEESAVEYVQPRPGNNQ